MKNLLINVFTSDLEWIGMIDKVESFTHRTSWHEMPASEMTVPKDLKGVEELQIGRILVVNNQLNKALIIEELQTTLTDPYIHFTLLPLKAILNYRICHPEHANNFMQKSQSEVMQILAFNNLINQTSDNDRKFMDSSFTKNMFIVSELKTYGDIIDYTVDWETGYLGDAITSVAKMYGVNTTAPLGWNIYIKSDYTAYIMDVWHGTHKHINQPVNNPVIFSEEFGNISNLSYEYSIKEWRNAAYIFWQEEIENAEAKKENIDRVNWIGNASNGITRSFNRKEILLKSSKKILNEVEAEARSELNKRPHIQNFTAEIIDNPNTMSTYKIDWDLGDIVTIQSKSTLKDQIISIDAMITEIEEIYDSGEYSINATFGEGKLSLMQLIKNEIKQK